MNNPIQHEPQPQPQPAAPAPEKVFTCKIFGVGTAGINVLDQIAKRNLPGVACIAVATDGESLAKSVAAEKLAAECAELRRPSAGAVTGSRTENTGESSFPSKLRAACRGAEVVLIVSGLGGDTGTALCPVLARAARESGALALAFVTLPFECEGNHRRHHAQQGLGRLKAEADGVICLPNQKVFKLIDETTSVLDAFKLMNEWLADGISGVWRLLARQGLIEIRRADLCAMLRDRHGESLFATADAGGATRSREAADRLLAHPLLDGGKALAEAGAVLVGIVGGPDLTMIEVNRVMESINSKCERAEVLMGAALDESFRERLAITLIATRHAELPAEAEMDGTQPAGTGRTPESLGDQLLSRTSTPRPHSRFLPPPPALPPEKMEQLMAKRTPATRPRRNASRMHQGQLPLDIVSKGRFDKSEPTIHKGEDLDVPTYIRRGMALN